jgi:hypothetical protein
MASAYEVKKDGTKVYSNRALQEAYELREARNAPILAEYDKAAAVYGPQGDYMKGITAALDRLAKKSVAQGQSDLVGSGLAGTSMMGGLYNRFAEEIAAPTLAQAQSEASRQLANISMQKAGFLGSQSPLTVTTVMGNTYGKSPQPTQGSAQPTQQSSSGYITGAKTPQLASLQNPAGTNASIPSLMSAMNPQPNTAVINGRQVSQDPTTGQWNFPIGMALQNTATTKPYWDDKTYNMKR